MYRQLLLLGQVFLELLRLYLLYQMLLIRRFLALVQALAVQNIILMMADRRDASGYHFYGLVVDLEDALFAGDGGLHGVSVLAG